MNESRRRSPRVLTHFDLELRERRGGPPLDAHGRAYDVSVGGFRGETRAAVVEGQSVSFQLDIEAGEPAHGEARVVWVAADSRGLTSFGAQITRMAWRDRRRLRAAISGRSYDFVALARRLFWTLYWIVVAVGAHNIINHQPLTLTVMGELIPVFVALVAAAASALYLLRG